MPITNDPMEYAIPANLKHAIDLVAQQHGNAAIILHVAGVVGWNSRWEGSVVSDKCERAAALLAQAADLLEEAEKESQAPEYDQWNERLLITNRKL